MRKYNAFFLAAAVLSALGAVAHELVGAPIVLGPLGQSGLPDNVVWLHHFSWHVGTIAVAAMVALFALAARNPQGRAFALIATAMSAAFAALAILLALFGSSVVWQTPAPYPWLVVALFGGVGMWSALRTNTDASSHE